MIDQYLLDQLSPAERSIVEDALRGDAALAAEVADLREVLAMIALSERVEVAPDLKLRLLRQIRSEASTSSSTPRVGIPFPAVRKRSYWTPVLGSILAASLLLTFKLARDFNSAQQAREVAESALAVQNLRLAQQDSLIQAFVSADVEVVTLVATGRGKPGVKTWLDRKAHLAMVTVASLDAPETGKAYQLWFIIPGEAPIPSVAFTPDADGHAFVGSIPMPDRVATASEITTAITVEAAGGSTVPTTPPIFVGTTAGLK